METPDPHAALDDKSVATRSAGVRDLARHGDWDDLARLVQMGWDDKSLPVRLYAAAAAADIVARGRGAFGQTPWTSAEQDQVLTWTFSRDPGTNPSMLMMAGLVETPAALKRLTRIVRDPRSDVRLGVVTALRRMVLSAASDHALVIPAVEAWLQDEKVPDDTQVELAKIVGEAGFAELRRVVVSLRSRGEAIAEFCDLSLDRLDKRKDPNTWTGVWHSDGLDVFELAVAPRTDDVAVVSPNAFVTEEGAEPLTFDEDGGATLPSGDARLVWATPLGTHEARVALQVGGRTWWQLPADEAADLLEARLETFQAMPDEAIAGLTAWIATQEGAAAARAQVIVAWLAGDLDGAMDGLDPMMKRKRPRIDLFFWRGRVHASAGRTAEALDDLRTFLDKAKKDAPMVEAARVLVQELEG